MKSVSLAALCVLQVVVTATAIPQHQSQLHNVVRDIQDRHGDEVATLFKRTVDHINTKFSRRYVLENFADDPCACVRSIDSTCSSSLGIPVVNCQCRVVSAGKCLGADLSSCPNTGSDKCADGSLLNLLLLPVTGQLGIVNAAISGLSGAVGGAGSASPFASEAMGDDAPQPPAYVPQSIYAPQPVYTPLPQQAYTPLPQQVYTPLPQQPYPVPPLQPYPPPPSAAGPVTPVYANAAPTPTGFNIEVLPPLPMVTAPLPAPQPQRQRPDSSCEDGYNKQCADDLVCVRDPRNTFAMLPANMCVSAEVTCGGLWGKACPKQSQICLDDPRDDCDPAKGDTSCDGICV